jgi:hypothetical protein
MSRGITFVPSFAPTKIAGCAIWLDAADTSSASMTFSSGSNISVWKDKSGNGNNFNVSAGTPSNISDNGFSVINFPYGAIMTSQNYISINGGSAAFVVSKISSVSGSGFGMLLAFPNIIGGDFSIRFIAQGLAGTQVNGGNGNDFSVNNYYITGNYNPNYALSYYSSSYNIVDTTSPNGSGYSQVSLSSSFYSRYFIGNIAELLIYPGGVSSTQRQLIEGYLAWKWGIQSYLPSDHPYKTNSVSGSSLKTPIVKATPYPLALPGCYMWLDGADTSPDSMTISSGTTISVWKDKSGRNNNATAGRGPTSSGTGIFFTGDQWFSMSSLAGALVNTTFTIFVVETLNTNGAAFFFGDDTISGYSSSLHIGYRNSGDLTFALWSTDLEDTNVSGTGTRRVWAFRMSNTYPYRTTRRNGAVDVSYGASNKLQAFLNPVLGRVFNGNYYYGTIHEVIVYVGDYPDYQIQSVENYLMKKWGFLAPLTRYISFVPKVFTTANLMYYLDAGNPASYPGSGSTWTDLQGSGIAMYLYGSPGYSSANGGYLTFSGSYQYGQSSASLPSMPNWTVEVWHYYTGTNSGGAPCLYSDVYPGSTYCIQIVLSAPYGDSVYTGFYNPNAGFFQSFPQSLTPGNWYQIVGTWDGSYLRLYLNGSLVNTRARNGTAAPNTGGFRIMRRWDLDDYWGGYLAILRLYNRAITDAEVAQNYAYSKARFGLT